MTGIWLLAATCFGCQSSLDSDVIAWQTKQVTLPLEEDWSGLYYTTVVIDGKPFRFLLDSGSSNLLYRKTFEVLGLEASGSDRIEDATGRISTTGRTLISRLRLGDLIIENAGFLVTDKPDVKCLEADGVIGWEIMNSGYWTFQPGAKKALISQGKPEVGGFGRIPLEFEKGRDRLLLASLTIGDETNEFLLDIGYSGYVAMPGPSGYEVANVRIADNSYEKVRLLQKPHIMYLLGLGFLKNFDFVIDWAAPALYLKPYTSTTFNKPMFGMSFEWTGSQQALLKSIVPGSPADSRDLPIGSRLLSYNGRILWKENDYCGMKNGMQSLDTLELVLEHESRRDTVTIHRGSLEFAETR